MSTCGCRRLLLALVLGLGAALGWGCASWGIELPWSASPAAEAPVGAERPVAPLVDEGAAPTAAPVDIRTLQAIDLARVREEHSRMIASIPTATPVPTEAPASVASRILLDDGDAGAAASRSLAPDPDLGIWWYRDSNRDWTGRRTRERNPYARLFYEPEFGNEHDSIVNGGIQERIGQMLVAEVVALLPELDQKGSELAAPITQRLGWELASDDLPVMRVWSRFSYLAPGDFEARDYRVGGVLTFGVADRRDAGTGDVLYQYAVVGDWLGPVLLEEAPAEG